MPTCGDKMLRHIRLGGPGLDPFPEIESFVNSVANSVMKSALQSRRGGSPAVRVRLDGLFTSQQNETGKWRKSIHYAKKHEVNVENMKGKRRQSINTFLG